MTSHSFRHCSMEWTKASSSSSSSAPSAVLAAAAPPAFPPLATAAAAATAAAEGPWPSPGFAASVWGLPSSACSVSAPDLASAAAGAGAAPMAPALGPLGTGPVFLPFRMSKASSSDTNCSRFAALKSLAPPPFFSSTCHRDLWSSKKVSTPSRPLSSGRACSPQTFTFMPIFRGSSDFAGAGAASAAGVVPAVLFPFGLGLSPAAGDAPAALAPPPSVFVFFWKSAKALKDGMAPLLRPGVGALAPRPSPREA
mmetsp:Transcript_108540/g.317573  ORF Transcript_108540/g.317573 Transcript_108540/m.317573 type:complete len:254 (-) Transcript_108540:7-768(-)